MHSTVDSGNAVCKGIDTLVIPRVPLQGDLDLLYLLGLFDVGDSTEQGFFRFVQMSDEVLNTSGVFEGDLLLMSSPLVTEADLETPLEERHHLESFRDSLSTKLDLVKDCSIWPERDSCPGSSARGRPCLFEWARWVPTIFERHLEALASAINHKIESA